MASQRRPAGTPPRFDDQGRPVDKRGVPLAGIAIDPSKRGRGPKKGAPKAGRPPDEFKAMLAELASREATLDAVRRILEDPSHPQFLRAMEFATERGYGKVAQAVEHTGAAGAPLEVLVTRRLIRPDEDARGDD